VIYHESAWKAWRTVHDQLHIVHKAVDNLQGLRYSHPSLILGEAVQPLEDGLDIASTLQQHLGELL